MNANQLEELLKKIPAEAREKEITYFDKGYEQSLDIERIEIGEDGSPCLTTRGKRLNDEESYLVIEEAKEPERQQGSRRPDEKPRCRCWISERQCPIHGGRK